MHEEECFVMQTSVTWKIFYKEQTWQGRAFLGHLEAQNLKTFPLSSNHCGAFVGLMYVIVCQKKTRDTSLYLYVYYFHVIKWIRKSKDLCAKKLKISAIQKQHFWILDIPIIGTL